MSDIKTKLSFVNNQEKFWVKQGGRNVNLTVTNDPFEFGDATSSRTRFGAKYIHHLDGTFVSYLGSAWGHKFDGASKSKAYGLVADTPTIKGNTVVFDLGFIFKSDPYSPMSFDFGLEAYPGVRQ